LVFDPSLASGVVAPNQANGKTAMMISSANILVIVIAAITAWMFGAAYHTPLGKVWLAAQGRPMAEACF
jgi:hypothetical protein